MQTSETKLLEIYSWEKECYCLKTATALPICETSKHYADHSVFLFSSNSRLIRSFLFLLSCLSCLGLYRLWGLCWKVCLVLVFLWCLAWTSELVFYTTVTMQPIKVNNCCTDHSTEWTSICTRT